MRSTLHSSSCRNDLHNVAEKRSTNKINAAIVHGSFQDNSSTDCSTPPVICSVTFFFFLNYLFKDACSYSND